jgi:hypothetical protein
MDHAEGGCDQLDAHGTIVVGLVIADAKVMQTYDLQRRIKLSGPLLSY